MLDGYMNLRVNYHCWQLPHGICVTGEIPIEIPTKQPVSVKQVIHLREGIDRLMAFGCFGMTG